MVSQEALDLVKGAESQKVTVESSSKGARPMEDIYLLDGDVVDLTGIENNFYREKVGKNSRTGKDTFAEYFLVSVKRGEQEVPARFYPTSIFKKVYEVDENLKTVQTHKAKGTVQDDLKLSKNLAADLVALAKAGKNKIKVSKVSDIPTVNFDGSAATGSICNYDWAA